eukprot:TRINITY_DN16596_c0_g2_i1.p1 TRINITY_DN16596_c0_g2~~TRINITY_DN16596_c0_g2_i1.p1  ORF type:complete len:313 (-),score=10.85 TRINITY_DN16596_c0_g2_i1:141-1079(-)
MFGCSHFFTSAFKSAASSTHGPRFDDHEVEINLRLAENSQTMPHAAAAAAARDEAYPSIEGQDEMPVMPSHRREFTIVLDRSAGKKIGCEIDDSDGRTLIVKRLKPGMIYDWNVAPGRDSSMWVWVEDRIIEVNGIRGDAAQMYEECMKHKLLNIRVSPSFSPEQRYSCLSEDSNVVVHVYDLWGVKSPATRLWNNLAKHFGVFHTAVEVYGREWYFGGMLDGQFDGVHVMDAPMQHAVHRHRVSIAMGRTMLSASDLDELIPLMRMRWPSWSYDPMRRNCHHFSNFFCQLLGFPAGPKCGLFGQGDSRLFT